MGNGLALAAWWLPLLEFLEEGLLAHATFAIWGITVCRPQADVVNFAAVRLFSSRIRGS